MTYVVTEQYIRCKYMDCIAVCPVDCFHAGENMLVINPDDCIDCDLCVAECPVDAIVPEDNASEMWIELNAEYSAKWPNITIAGRPPEDADDYQHMPDKFEKFFSPEPDAEV